MQFLVDVDDWSKIDGLIADIQKHLDEKHPNANAVAKKFLLGPGQGGRIQARFRGPDPAKLRELADQAKRVLEDDGGAVCVRSDWREREKVIRPDLLELQARRNGITRVEVAQALESSFEGRVVGFYREPGSAGTGVYPQETRLLPIVARPPLAERDDVHAINSLQIWSPVAGRMIPLSQVTSGAEVVWEDPIVMRRDRFPTLTVHADPRSGLPSQLFNRVRPKIEQIELPPGYSLEWGGEYEDSARRPRRPGQAPPLRAGAHGVHRRVSVQFDPHHAPDLADHAACDHRRDGGAAADRHAVRLHGPLGSAHPGRRADQEPDRRPEQDLHRDRQGEGTLPSDPGRGREQDAAGVHGRVDHRPRV